MQIGGPFYSRLDRTIRNLASFGVALLTIAYMLLHPQLAERRPALMITSVLIMAWLVVYFGVLMQPSRKRTWVTRAGPYAFVLLAGWVNWLHGREVPFLALLYPIASLLPAYGRSRAEGWGLAVTASATAMLTPCLAGHLDGRESWLATIYFSGCTAILVGSFTELHHHHNTLYRQQAQRLQRAETMATVGLMATAAAHEIRNPLTSIKGFLQYMRQHGLVDERADGYLTLLGEDADRIARTVDRFVRLGRPLSPVPVRVDVTDVARALVGELSAQALLVGVEMAVEAEPVPPVWADLGMLKKALRHTLQNGLDALAGQSGRLTVRIAPGPPGFVAVNIHDTGPGMDRQQLARAFDVFYTTKAGAGLGLPLVRRIMDAHGGDIRLTSSRRRGTTVSLLWPTRPTAPAGIVAALHPQ